MRVHPRACVHIRECSRADTGTGLMPERAAMVMGDQQRWPYVTVHDVPVRVHYSCV